jgi:hypothetical protein
VLTQLDLPARDIIEEAQDQTNKLQLRGKPMWPD